MSQLDSALSRLADRGHPIGSDVLIAQLERQLTSGSAPEVVALDTRRRAMETMAPKTEQPTGWWRGARVGWAALLGTVAVVVVAIVLATGSNGSNVAGDNPAAVLADYLEVWNAEDAEAVMAFYAEDAVLEGHPSDTDELAIGKSEILSVEATIDRFQGSTGKMEFINIEVSGDTVTFDNIFHNAQGTCFSSAGSAVTVADGKITLFVWGDTDADLCG